MGCEMNDEKIFDILMSLQKDVSSIKTDIGNIKEQNKEIKEHSERLDKLENKVSQHDGHFKLLWYIVTGVLIFLGADILAPLIVNWLSK